MQGFRLIGALIFLACALFNGSLFAAENSSFNKKAIRDDGDQIEAIREEIKRYQAYDKFEEGDFEDVVQAMPMWFFQLREIAEARRSHGLGVTAEILERQLRQFALNYLALDQEHLVLIENDLTLVRTRAQLQQLQTTSYFSTGLNPPLKRRHHIWISVPKMGNVANAALPEYILLPENEGPPTGLYGNIYIHSGQTLKTIATVPADDLESYIGMSISEIIQRANLKQQGIYGARKQHIGEVGFWIETEKTDGLRFFFSQDEEIFNLADQGFVAIFREIRNRKFSDAQRKQGRNLFLVAELPRGFFTSESGKGLTPLTLMSEVLKRGQEFADIKGCKNLVKALRKR